MAGAEPDRDMGAGGGNGNVDGGDMRGVDGNLVSAGCRGDAIVAAGRVGGPTGCVYATVKLAAG